MSEADDVRLALRDAIEEALDLKVSVDEILCTVQQIFSDKQVAATQVWTERQQRRV